MPSLKPLPTPPSSGLVLPNPYRGMLLEIAAATLPPEIEIWAFGSRVTGDCHEGSDLDLALRLPDGCPVPRAALARFRQALHDSLLPILVDVADYTALPPAFRAAVDAVGVRIE